jgi:hypothetical protein
MGYRRGRDHLPADVRLRQVADFNVRSDAVNVEQIMEQIRSRIREKRGVDYTEEQIRELATVKLQKFLDPRGVRSDLLDQFRRAQPLHQPPALPNYAFEDGTLFDSHRGALRFIRRLLKPILKLFFNPNPLIQALHIQSRVNSMLNEREARLEATESLYYELIHNLVVETTRLGIEVKNLTMRVESMSSRLEFSERRARALESAVGDVIYKPAPSDIVVAAQAAAVPPAAARDARGSPAYPPQRTEPAQVGQHAQGQSRDGAAAGEGPGQRSRRRRRRRGRRGAVPASVVMREAPQPSAAAPAGPAATPEAAAPGELSTREESATVAEPASGGPPVQPAAPSDRAAAAERAEAPLPSMPAPSSDSEPQ